MTRAARALLGAALVPVAAAALVWRAMPPAAIVLTPAADPLVVRGALHVHTRRSDGTGSVDDVARAAARAGLQFVILTDHGDGTRVPDPPAYRSGVLCLDGVEISTTGGHYLALGLQVPAPFRLAGEPRDVLEDVGRLNGFGVVAHPDSKKPELQWNAWEATASQRGAVGSAAGARAPAFAGVEWLNGDSAWRDEGPGALARVVATYFVRPAESIVSLIDYPGRTLRRYDQLTRDRRLVLVAGHDAHAHLGWRGNWEPGEAGEWALRLPSYEAAFRAFSLGVRLDEPLRGAAHAQRDAGTLLRAVAAGRVFCVLTAVAGPATIEYTARADSGEVARDGDVLKAAGLVTFVARVTPAAGVSLRLLRNGQQVHDARGPTLDWQTGVGPDPAAWRVEAYVDGGPGSPPVPWIAANPVYTGAVPPVAPVPVVPPVRRLALSEGPSGVGWTIEKHREVEAAIESPANATERAAIAVRYRLGRRPAPSLYAALVRTLVPGAFADVDRIRFEAGAARPMRVSVQVRAPAGDAEGLRWQRSVYLDQAPRAVTVFLDDMRGIGPAEGLRPDRSRLDSLLLVVDDVHTLAGSAGRFWVRDVGLDGPAAAGAPTSVP